MKRWLVIALLLASVGSTLAQAPTPPQEDPSADRAIPYTLADRDRAVRMEEALLNQNRRLDELQGQMSTFFGITLAAILGLVGLIVWDRRTTAALSAKEATTPFRKELDEHLALIQKLQREIAELKQQKP